MERMANMAVCMSTRTRAANTTLYKFSKHAHVCRCPNQDCTCVPLQAGQACLYARLSVMVACTNFTCNLRRNGLRDQNHNHRVGPCVLQGQAHASAGGASRQCQAGIQSGNWPTASNTCTQPAGNRVMG